MAITIERKTKETDISVVLGFPSEAEISIDTGIPFLNHMLTAMAFHGCLSLTVKARGDLDVDYHHTVEDVGIVLGQALKDLMAEKGAVSRYGNSVLPMDDALGEAVIDLGGRAYLVYRAEFPQDRSGDFDMALFREFFVALSSNAAATMHLSCRYGENSHHMIEALFKALGRALRQALQPVESVRSTKGTLGS